MPTASTVPCMDNNRKRSSIRMRQQLLSNVPFLAERKVPKCAAAIDHGEAWKTSATIAAEHHRTDSSGEKKNINNDGQQLQKWWERRTEEFNGGKGSTTFRYYGANNGQRTVVPPPVPPKLSSSPIGSGNAKFGQNRLVAGHHGDAAGAMPRGKHKNISIPPAQGHIGVGGGRRLSPSSVAEDRCEQCGVELSGSFVLAKNRCWCPEHFVCANSACARCLLESGFVEEPQGRKNYCPVCYECLIAPVCQKCFLPLTETCLNALGEKWHTECFTCTHCRKPFGTHSFFVEDGKPYCEDDWNMLFTTKCSDCTQPIKVGQKWLEALGGQFHANCFKCAACGIELEGKTYFERAQRPFCRAHATAAAV
uniref:LIM domain protein n=1 Tax=Globodera pallida TaxID=36090 RepID=A0A183C5S2_GLOPA